MEGDTLRVELVSGEALDAAQRAHVLAGPREDCDGVRHAPARRARERRRVRVGGLALDSASHCVTDAATKPEAKTACKNAANGQ